MCTAPAEHIYPLLEHMDCTWTISAYFGPLYTYLQGCMLQLRFVSQVVWGLHASGAQNQSAGMDAPGSCPGRAGSVWARVACTSAAASPACHRNQLVFLLEVREKLKLAVYIRCILVPSVIRQVGERKHPPALPTAPACHCWPWLPHSCHVLALVAHQQAPLPARWPSLQLG